MRNGLVVRRLLERVYVEGADHQRAVLTVGVPALLRQAVPLHDVIAVDLHVPGCPPRPELLRQVLGGVVEGRCPVVARARFG